MILEVRNLQVGCWKGHPITTTSKAVKDSSFPVFTFLGHHRQQVEEGEAVWEMTRIVVCKSPESTHPGSTRIIHVLPHHLHLAMSEL